MRVVCKGHILFPVLTLFLCIGSAAQQVGLIESMKLLTPDTGWAATNKKLFWTTNGGVQWKEITPKLNHKRQMLSSIFFLDSSSGWVLLSCGDDRDPIADDVCFEFASTTDAGENWSIVLSKIIDPVSRSVIEDGQGFSNTAYLDFADSQHGWAILQRSLPVGRSSGQMLRTVDGGRTWTQLAKDALPVAGNFHFVDAQDGWMAGGPDHDLYVTHDAGDLWQQVSLPKPASVGPDTGADYGLPVFESERRGFLSIRYAVGPLMGPDLSTLVLFATDDAGRTWKQDRILTRIPHIYSSDMVDSVLIAAHSEQKKEQENGGRYLTAKTNLSLYTLDRVGSTASSTAEVSSQGATTQLSFVGQNQGWANLSDGLFATHDAGKTWVDITPGPRHPFPRSGIQAPVESIPMQGTAIPQSISPSPGNNISTHLGFDAYNVPTVSQMSTWMNSSPFYDIYIYLPQSPNRHNDPILSSSQGPTWISSVDAQGWGIGPIWFGLQSTCVNATNITQFISTTPGTASTQGAAQADSAVAQDKLLGITSGIIYLDIESYTIGGVCSAAVQAYVDGFVSEIGTYSGYSAGVYANPASIKSDISQVSPAPSAIWITKTPPKTNPIPSVTIWNQGIPDSSTTNSKYWPNGQRMHQFLFNTNAKSAPNATWGGVSLSIDYDIDNGPVVNANNGVKPFSTLTFTNFNYPGATFALAKGINDIWGGSFINGPSEIGQIVGGYYDSTGVEHGFLLDAFVSPTTIDYPGQYSGEAEGINSSGQIIGVWIDTSHCSHGYLYSAGTFTSIDNPNATCAAGGTGLSGINDAGQITGSYCGANGCGSFLYYSKKYYSVSYTGASGETTAQGINGDAMITGNVGGLNPPGLTAFTESPIPPSWTGTFSSFFDGAGSNTYGQGMNNNGDVAGYYFVQNLNDYGLLFTNGVQLVSFQYPASSDTFATGVNDLGHCRLLPQSFQSI